MWVITVYSPENDIAQFEFTTEQEAREAFERLQGCKILTEVIYFNDEIILATA
ncbi:hypothetical protein ABER68_25880 [Paenibacillus alvei]